MKRACILLIAVLGGCVTPHRQAADPSFDAIVAAPAFRTNGPRMLFDDAHNNFHRSDGRYAPFVTLMRNDGFVVVSNTMPFSEETLAGHDVLVIVNAEGVTDDASAFAGDEIDAVSEWVRGGGSLLLVADHSPFGKAANALSERFGVTMVDSFLKDEDHHDSILPGPFFLLFTRDNGLLVEHPITDGIQRVLTFGGQALRINGDGDAFLRLSPQAMIVKDRTKPNEAEPAGDAVHAVALRHGLGRVVILGEAAALTAQVITGEAAQKAGMTEMRIGMSRTDMDNKQLALNIAHWLVADR
jgi:hypothetical protein